METIQILTVESTFKAYNNHTEYMLSSSCKHILIPTHFINFITFMVLWMYFVNVRIHDLNF